MARHKNIFATYEDLGRAYAHILDDQRVDLNRARLLGAAAILLGLAGLFAGAWASLLWVLGLGSAGLALVSAFEFSQRRLLLHLIDYAEWRSSEMTEANEKQPQETRWAA